MGQHGDECASGHKVLHRESGTVRDADIHRVHAWQSPSVAAHGVKALGPASSVAPCVTDGSNDLFGDPVLAWLEHGGHYVQQRQ